MPKSPKQTFPLILQQADYSLQYHPPPFHDRNPVETLDSLQAMSHRDDCLRRKPLHENTHHSHFRLHVELILLPDAWHRALKMTLATPSNCGWPVLSVSVVAPVLNDACPYSQGCEDLLKSLQGMSSRRGRGFLRSSLPSARKNGFCGTAMILSRTKEW